MNEIKIEFRGNWMELANEDRRILKDIADLVDEFNARRQADTSLPAEPTPEPAQGSQQK